MPRLGAIEVCIRNQYLFSLMNILVKSIVLCPFFFFVVHAVLSDSRYITSTTPDQFSPYGLEYSRRSHPPVTGAARPWDPVRQAPLFSLSLSPLTASPSASHTVSVMGEDSGRGRSSSHEPARFQGRVAQRRHGRHRLRFLEIQRVASLP